MSNDFNIDEYKKSNDGWVRSLATNGLKMGMTPEEIEYLILKREKEQTDYNEQMKRKRKRQSKKK